MDDYRVKYFSAYRAVHPGLLLEPSGLVAIVVLALIIRFNGITVPAVWYDEAFSLLLAQQTPGQIWSITALDVHPPLYYLLLHYWMLMFGNGVFSARSLSALADVGSLLLCLKLMSLIATRRALWIAALLLALLPISVRYSQEVRMYTLLGFWLMGATLALVCWVNAPQQKRFPIIYVILMTAAFYTHYFAGLCVLVHWVFWWRARGISIPAWAVANSAIVILFLPWLPHFIDQVSNTKPPGWLPPVTLQTVLTAVWPFTVLSDFVPVASWWRVIPTVLILVCATAVLLKDRSAQRYSVLLVGYFFLPVMVVLLLSLLTPLFNPRYLLFASVGLPMIFAIALDRWVGKHSLCIIVAVMLLVIVQVPGLLTVYRQTDELNGTRLRNYFRVDTLASEIKRQALPGDEIVLDSLIYFLPFTYYNTMGIQPRFYIRSSMDIFLGHLDRGGYLFIPKPLHWIFFNDIEALKPARRVWLITEVSAFEDHVLFADNWSQTVTIKSGLINARLFTLDATPAPTEAGAQTMITLPPLQPAQNYPPAPSATSASKTRHSLPR